MIKFLHTSDRQNVIPSFQTHMVSFQCSRHATAEGIIGVFKLCANYQKKRDMDKFVSVVVLDEVGLAEDSENMPLKVRQYSMTCQQDVDMS